MLKKWKKLSRSDVLIHPRMHIVEDEVELPNGTITQYLLHAPVTSHSVTIIAVNKEDKVLLQKEYSYPPNDVLWQLPGGGIERNEDIIVAAQRELSEESGITASECQIIGYFYTDNRRSDRKQFVVVGRKLHERRIKGDTEEFIENYWVTVDEIKHKITNSEFHNMNLLAALNLWLHGQQ